MLNDHLAYSHNNSTYPNLNSFTQEKILHIFNNILQINLSNYNLAIIDAFNEEIFNYCFNQFNRNYFNNPEELFYHKHKEHIKDSKSFYLNCFWFIITNYNFLKFIIRLY